jgi:arabinogalactan endo-1,4-beta-galactosidase
MMRKIFSLLFLLFTITASADGKYVGGDISLLPSYIDHGAKFLDREGNTIASPLAYFGEQGMNAMRVRLFVNPANAPADHKGQGVVQDLAYVKRLGKMIKDAGMALMLDFHYSDTWTDPGKHSTPAGWPSSPDALADKLYDYTKECLNELIAAGVTPDFVQPGNEITYGMLWPTGHCYPDGGSYSGGTFANFAKYLQAGIRAIREVCPQAKIVIQTEMSRSQNVTNFYKTLKNYTDDYDIIGISYYPHFHGTLSTLKSVLDHLQNNYPDKKIQIVETGYYHKWYPDDATYKQSSFPNWPATDEGQLQFTKDLIATLNQYKNVNGLFWWMMEANEYGLDWNTKRVTDNWYNASLFDNETGRAEPALYVLKDFLGESAGISETAVPDKEIIHGVFTLDGQHVGNALDQQPKGIYIVDGKKVIKP